ADWFSINSFTIQSRYCFFSVQYVLTYISCLSQFILQEVDITLPENSSWYDKYKYDIPVFHLNGNFLMKHRVDIQKFEDQLTKLELQNDGNQ
uniref:Glutaredoxin-like protein n=1 Tax=Apteryx owenii TaxID=8824 RepID=A0A8B9QHV5_APTOW